MKKILTILSILFTFSLAFSSCKHNQESGAVTTTTTAVPTTTTTAVPTTTTTAVPTTTTTAVPTTTTTAVPTTTTTAVPTTTTTAVPTTTTTAVPTTTTTAVPTTTTTAVPTATTTEIAIDTSLTQSVAEIVNKHRTAAGLSSLSYDNTALNDAAMLRAKELATYYSHDRPDGSSCFTVLGEFELDYKTVGENIAWGSGAYDSAESVMDGWMDSKGHYENIMNPKFSEIGVGVYIEKNQFGNQDSYHWCQIFYTKK